MAPCDVVSSKYAGESVFLYHSDRHRWFWFSDQEVNEALLFCSYDSHPAENQQGCFHSSGRLHHAGQIGAKPRRSVEVRAVVITPRL